MLIETLIEIFHSVNRFLGSISGELFKDSFELVLFTFTTYMIISEYLRMKENKQLKELAFGFGILSSSKLLATVILGLHVFGGFAFTNLFAHIYLLEVIVELFAVWALIRFFVEPIISKKNPRTLKYLSSVTTLVVVLAIVCGSSLNSIYTNEFDDFFDIRGSLHFALLNLIRAVFLIAAVTLMAMYYPDFKRTDRYHRSLFHAFILYTVSPTLQVLNYAFYMGNNSALAIISYPFPFIAVAQFTRVMFLRIADKAELLDRLNLTEKKYIKAQEVCELKDEFVSVVSHELKTPLTSINLYASMLQKGTLGPSNEGQQEAYRTIKEECNRLSTLIQDMLDVSKLESKKMKLHIEKIDLSALVETSLLKHMAEGKNIELRNDVPPGSFVSVDPDRMKQVLINLQSNAIKFTDSGYVRVGFARKGKSWEFFVEDTGVGIPKNKIGKLFDKFYQVETHLTRKVGGTGLGLSIVKQIVELHGGKVIVTSVEGKGSKFRVVMGK